MSFEIRERDVLARIGRVETRHGVLETPVLLPVVNPSVQLISPRVMLEEFDCSALMTNAYIIKRRFGSEPGKVGIHRFLDFDGVVMTDSGAYQILVYGDVETSNREIIEFQEQIGSDIATILDIPTGWGVSERYAKHTVEETLNRAAEWNKIRSASSVSWVGPVQGGVRLNLIAKSAEQIGKLPFQVHALGSPTPVMEQYFFDSLVDMIMTAKMHLPLDRPLHLFGAGGPFMFSLAVALGCDMFDSAAYAIYAREDRYMTESGTVRLRELKYFPCSCGVCAKTEPKELSEMPKRKREEFLARHNLHISLTEIKRVKQAIFEGRLWEYLEMKSHSHPALLRAFRKLGEYGDYLEGFLAVSKKSGLFFNDSDDLVRPEVTRHGKRLSERFNPPTSARVLVLLPQTRTKPFHESREQRRVYEALERSPAAKKNLIHVCTYAAPFGVIPAELDEVYPLSQYEIASPFDSETVEHVADHVRRYIRAHKYSAVVLLEDVENWRPTLATACKQACKEKKIKVKVLEPEKLWSKSMLTDLVTAVRSSLGERT